MGVGVGVGVGVGSGVGVGVSVGVEGLPVPVACRFWPLWRYSSMPSMWRTSSMLMAEARAIRATTTKSIHDCRIALSMFGE